MLFALAIAIPLILGSPWIFVYFSPAGVDSRRLRRFNAGAITLAVLLCVGISLWVRAALMGSEDVAWWPVVALLFSAGLFPFTLLVSGLIRNFVVFR